MNKRAKRLMGKPMKRRHKWKRDQARKRLGKKAVTPLVLPRRRGGGSRSGERKKSPTEEKLAVVVLSSISKITIIRALREEGMSFPEATRAARETDLELPGSLARALKSNLKDRGYIVELWRGKVFVEN